ncbi:ABC transporter ATP-binding protein [Rhodovarius crocodyli]|uniref:ABC transporter ATP-binding protein n=1 Tax=Rhodovarius crocodyli TaxID=1979269 RepID=A0A437MLV2_9PROT|nr:ABC transporter ATP-binding protein [Rhodovarius crocodyli]RVT98637.1 ABC transporter ATP-binding protein [Rhodovarius crocodyli]
MSAPPMVQVGDLRKHFSQPGLFRRGQVLRAVQDVSFDIAPGETLGLVGESGSGKSTLGRMVVGLLPATSGSSVVAGMEVTRLKGQARRALWRRAQMVFQDPYSSLNPRMTVREAIGEPLRNFGIARGAEAEAAIRRMTDLCGLPASALDRYPREFSGGQRQRIGIARALVLRPDVVVADEPVSALDVSIQAQIINLLQDLRQEFGLTYLFIAHDLAVVRHVSDRVAVMYRGHLVEIGPAERIYAAPRHPYTRLLLDSVPSPDPAAEARRQALPRPEETPVQSTGGGCVFAARCPLPKLAACFTQQPPLLRQGPMHLVACHAAEKASPA